MNVLLAGKLDFRAAPWMVGAPLIALQKKTGGFRPIAIGDVIRRLASRLCCKSVHSLLPDIFLPYHQVGVAVLKLPSTQLIDLYKLMAQRRICVVLKLI